MDTALILNILYIVLVIFFLVIWTLLTIILVKVIKLLWPIEKILWPIDDAADAYWKVKWFFTWYSSIPNFIKWKLFGKRRK